jgi:hypothetical protein
LNSPLYRAFKSKLAKKLEYHIIRSIEVMNFKAFIEAGQAHDGLHDHLEDCNSIAQLVFLGIILNLKKQRST